MSDWRTLGWRSGRLIATNKTGFWELGSLAGTKDPAIPNLNLESAVASNDLTATVTFAFTNTAAIAGIGNLTAATSFAFTPTATLTGFGNIDGATSFAFAPSGAVTGIGNIAGSTTVTFAPSGAIAGLGDITGATSFAFTLAGDVQDAANNDITGATSFAFTATATVENIATGTVHGRRIRGKRLILPGEFDEVIEEMPAPPKPRAAVKVPLIGLVPEVSGEPLDFVPTVKAAKAQKAAVDAAQQAADAHRERLRQDDEFLLMAA